MVDQDKNNVLPLELAYVQSPYEYAEIVSIDTSEAIKVPGVVSIITANDIPGDNNILGSQGSCELLAEKFVNYQGQILAIVVAEDIKIANNMMETMIKAPGVGLAANQVGILKQIVTINFEDKENNKKANYILFNPLIIQYSEEKVIMEEGCLSLPEQYAEVERPKEIILEYVNENEKIIKKEIDGFEARILQHEIDHLSGKLFVDYLSSLKRNVLIKKVKKLQNSRK